MYPKPRSMTKLYETFMTSHRVFNFFYYYWRKFSKNFEVWKTLLPFYFSLLSHWFSWGNVIHAMFVILLCISMIKRVYRKHCVSGEVGRLTKTDNEKELEEVNGVLRLCDTILAKHPYDWSVSPYGRYEKLYQTYRNVLVLCCAFSKFFRLSFYLFDVCSETSQNKSIFYNWTFTRTNPAHL